MTSKLIQVLFLLFTALYFQGCIVGTVVAAPFHVAGAVINTVTPDIVGDSVSATGDVLDTVIPF